MKALHYITGDTQQSGFRRIGGSVSFPADTLPYLNNREPISEQARVSSGSNRAGGGGLQQLSHVWEYQTGDYGRPVLINTIVAIGTARQHAFSEYVLGETPNAAEAANPWQLIRSAEENTHLLDMETFMSIPGQQEVTCEEDEWRPEEITDAPRFDHPVNDRWKLVVLSHYWKQASIRAFSPDSPTTVRVCLGEFSDDPLEDNEKTIEQAKLFFADVLVKGLPRQVQNIASVAAGVNCADSCTLYTALEFDVTLNMYEDETLHLERPREPRLYHLSEAELAFMEEVSSGKTPQVVSDFFDRYRKLTERGDASELDTPFMADYRVWYALYCMDQIIKEKDAFIEKAELYNEHGNPQRVKPARSCFTLMHQLHQLLEGDHRVGENNRTLVTELLEPLETGLMKYMLECMNRDDAQSFMLKRNDMLEFHRRTLYTAPETQLDTMISLAVRDQQLSRAPQFVRCWPGVPVRNEQADARNAKALSAVLAEVIRPLIDAEKNHEKIENKYLNELRSEDFAQKWACLNQNVQTRKAVADFLREEIQDPQKHFLLYGISKIYLPLDELLQVTLKHFTENNIKRNAQPNERQMRIALDGCREYVAKANAADPACVSALNGYYRACYGEYRGGIAGISEIVEQLGGDTSEAMRLIFQDAAAEERRMTPDEARAVFETLGGREARYAKNEQVIGAYADMIAAHRQKMLTETDSEHMVTREGIIKWIADMAAAAPFDLNTSDSIRAIIASAKTGVRMSADEAKTLFASLGGQDNVYAADEQVVSAYNDMLKTQWEAVLQDTGDELEMNRETIIRWIADMADNAPFDVDTSDAIRSIFESAKTGQRISRISAEEAFNRLMPHAVSGNEKVRPAFSAMLKTQLDSALEQKDESILDWISGMMTASDGHISLDTTDMLKKIFDSAKEGERMQPGSATQALNTLGRKAEGINSTVKRSYTEMLSARRKEALAAQDTEAFTWLCEMGDRSPWRNDVEWLSEQHSENIAMLCDISQAASTAADTTFLSTIQAWLEQGTVSPRGNSRLQKYCNIQMEQGNQEPAERFLPFFDQMDSSNESLREVQFTRAKERLLEGLAKGTSSFGDMVTACKTDVERAGKRLDDLYNETKPQVTEYLNHYFETTNELKSLIDEQDRIPVNTAFYQAWQDMLSRRIFNQQVELFNRQPNMERLLELKRDVLSRSRERNASLEAAYELLEGYEGRLDKLSEASEYEAVTGMGNQLSEINGKLDRAYEVRKTLCSAIRNVNWPEQKKLESRSFRHRICSAVLQASLTDEAKSVTNELGTTKGCPDWNKVLSSLFPRAELDEASKKPYAKKNLPVLQRFLSTLETARVMSAYGMNTSWAEELLKTIHSNADLHRYQSALARNKKMSERYNLSFNADGLQFNMKTE